MKITRSPIWNYFTKIDADKALCSVCNNPISYKWSITNLKGHLRCKHIPAYTELMCIYAELENDDKELEDYPTPPIAATPSLTAITPRTTAASPCTTTTQLPAKRQKVLDLPISQEQKKVIDRDLLDLFIKDFQPFSIVEDAGFSKLMKWIPGYELPTRKTISTIMLPSLYNQHLQATKHTVHQEAKSVCITTDFWDESYIFITGHYITAEFDFKSILLNCSDIPGGHTPKNLANGLKVVVAEWKLEDKVNFTVSDNTSNITTAFENVLKWKHYGCYASTLNLIVQRSLCDLQPMLEKIRKITGHFKTNTSANVKFLKYQLSSGASSARCLIQDVTARWNSTFNMLNRFVELKEAITNTIPSMDTNLPMMTNMEWQTCRQLCEILSPFEEMTKSMCGQKYMTGSSVIVVTRCLRGTCERLQGIKKYSKAAKSVISSLKKSLDDEFKNIENNTTFALCTLLDPRYKHHVFQDHSALEMAKAKLKSLVVSLIQKHYSEPYNVSTQPETASGATSAWCILNELIEDKCSQNTASSKAFQEVESYFKDDILPRLKENGENSCPLDWWKKHQHVYPNLAEIFRTRCNIVATSLPRERLFSKTGNLISDRNTRLTSKRVEMIMFLNANAELNPEKNLLLF